MPPVLRAIVIRLGVAAALAGLAVGLRAGSLAEADQKGWRTDRLLDIGVVVFGVLTVCLVVTLLIVRPTPGGLPPAARRRSTVRSLIMLGSAFVLAYLFLHRGRPPVQTARPSLPDATPVPFGATDGTASTHGSPLVLALLLLVMFLTLVVAARRRRALPEPVGEVEPEVPGDLEQAARAAGAALRERPDEPPRERVLSAYEAFERVLADQGLRRGVSGTATGLLERAVAAGAPAAPATDLTRLFGIARFGSEPMTAAHVSLAERALLALEQQA